MEAGGGRPVPGPGWFPDPHQQAPYRWWDGLGWTGHLWPPPPAPRPPTRRPLRVALVVLQVLFWGYAVLWVLLLPAMVLSDADNGALGHDFATIWLPEVTLGCLGALSCIAGLLLERRGAPAWKAWAGPAVAAVTLVAVSLFVLPGGGGS